jgi:hypothetical protein
MITGVEVWQQKLQLRQAAKSSQPVVGGAAALVRVGQLRLLPQRVATETQRRCTTTVSAARMPAMSDVDSWQRSDEIDALQDQVLQQLDELNRRVEEVIRAFSADRDAAAGSSAAAPPAAKPAA